MREDSVQDLSVCFLNTFSSASFSFSFLSDKGEMSRSPPALDLAPARASSFVHCPNKVILRSRAGHILDTAKPSAGHYTQSLDVYLSFESIVDYELQ